MFLKLLGFQICAYFFSIISGCQVFCNFAIFHEIKVAKYILEPCCHLESETGSWLILVHLYDINHNDTQHNDIQQNDIQHNDTQHNNKKHALNTMTHSITALQAVCHYAELHYAECHLCWVLQRGQLCWVSVC